MSTVGVSLGSAWNSSQVQLRSWSTAPVIVNVHSSSGVRGWDRRRGPGSRARGTGRAGAGRRAPRRGGAEEASCEGGHGCNCAYYASSRAIAASSSSRARSRSSAPASQRALEAVDERGQPLGGRARVDAPAPRPRSRRRPAPPNSVASRTCSRSSGSNTARPGSRPRRPRSVARRPRRARPAACCGTPSPARSRRRARWRGRASRRRGPCASRSSSRSARRRRPPPPRRSRRGGRGRRAGRSRRSRRRGSGSGGPATARASIPCVNS